MPQETLPAEEESIPDKTKITYDYDVLGSLLKKEDALTAANPSYTATTPLETGSRWTTNPVEAIRPTMSLGE